MAFTNTGSTAILNGLIGKSSSGPLSSCYLALSSTTPNQDGTNFTEPPQAGERLLILGCIRRLTAEISFFTERYHRLLQLRQITFRCFVRVISR